MRLLRRVPLIALALAACKPAAEAPAEKMVVTDRAPGLMLIDGMLVLPAVAGNPAAGYFKLANPTDKAVTISSASVAGAERTEMHETSGSSMKPLANVPIGAADSSIFKPGGKHLMVFGVPATTKPGDSVQLTLTFADGKKLSAPLKIEAPGMAMDHGDMH